jgi:hypothetical protein
VAEVPGYDADPYNHVVDAAPCGLTSLVIVPVVR